VAGQVPLLMTRSLLTLIGLQGSFVSLAMQDVGRGLPGPGLSFVLVDL
jgi:hypothetical protein